MDNMPKIKLILHNIRSTHNIGSIFRTAEGFGVNEIIISGYTPYPLTVNDPRLPHIAEKLTAQIHKTALGAENMIKFSYVENIEQWLAESNLPVVALEQAPHSVSLSDFQRPEEFSLLLGEEVHGIEQPLLRLVNHVVEIPMAGQKESFNVSVAAGIALYALTQN